MHRFVFMLSHMSLHFGHWITVFGGGSLMHSGFHRLLLLHRRRNHASPLRVRAILSTPFSEFNAVAGSDDKIVVTFPNYQSRVSLTAALNLASLACLLGVLRISEAISTSSSLCVSSSFCWIAIRSSWFSVRFSSSLAVREDCSSSTWERSKPMKYFLPGLEACTRIPAWNTPRSGRRTWRAARRMWRRPP